MQIMNNCNIPPNDRQVMKNLGVDMAFGALGGALTGGPPGAVMGAALGAAQNVTIGMMNHGPVNVPIPHLPMGPTQLHQTPKPNILGNMPFEHWKSNLRP
jgi:hypothetical protein